MFLALLTDKMLYSNVGTFRQFTLGSIWEKGTLTDENKNMGISVSKRIYCQRLDFRNLEFQN